MASSLYNLALDFSKELNYTKAIMARQGDKGITVTVKPFLNGLKMDTSGGTFTLKGTTPSNRYIDSVATSVTSEEVTFSLDGTFMSEAGYYKHCYVEYRKGNQILTTQDIIFFSLGVSDISQGQADEYVSQLEELIRKYNETFDAFMAEIKVRVDSLNQQITDLTGQAKILQDKLDALKEEISKLGNLHVMYSNSIDFGDYDYSGNPNLMNVIKASDFRRDGGSDVLISDVGYNSIRLTSQNTNSIQVYSESIAPSLVSGKTYTISAKIKIEEGTTGNINEVKVSYRKTSGGTILLYANTKNAVVGKEIIIKGTSTVNYEITNLSRFYVSIGVGGDINGSVIVSDIKIEEGSTATPYQPNLLDAPYYLSKVALGENLIKPESQQPVTNSNYLINTYNIKPMVKGKKYTITLEGTKPATQVFRPFFTRATGDAWEVGDLQPVEGLTNVWSKTFTAADDSHPTTPQVQIYQVPSTSVGQCTIKWLKLEEGNTRTPNIEQYKYRGIGMRDSNNPKDYVWDLAPEYVEDNLATDVKISEITGKANNYTDLKVSEINSQLTASINEVDKKVTANTKSITTINSTLTEMQKPVKYEAWFSGGTELRPANANSRFRVSEERLTIGTKLNVAMNESPLEWNADRWEATFTRECSILVDVQTMVEFADQWGTYVYINMWKDTNQTQTWDTGYGMGIASGANFWFRTELSVSMYCMNAKVGDKFSIGLGMASGKSLTSARIHKLHIMEL
ncbi:BppU family phage baseplate upper protein [Enterococcus lactis]